MLKKTNFSNNILDGVKLIGNEAKPTSSRNLNQTRAHAWSLKLQLVRTKLEDLENVISPLKSVITIIGNVKKQVFLL